MTKLPEEQKNLRTLLDREDVTLGSHLSRKTAETCGRWSCHQEPLLLKQTAHKFENGTKTLSWMILPLATTDALRDAQAVLIPPLLP